MQQRSRKARPIFQQPFSLPENAQTLAGIAFHAAGKSGNHFPAATKFAGKLFQQQISDSHSLLEFSDYWVVIVMLIFKCIWEGLKEQPNQKIRICVEATNGLVIFLWNEPMVYERERERPMVCENPKAEVDVSVQYMRRAQAFPWAMLHSAIFTPRPTHFFCDSFCNSLVIFCETCSKTCNSCTLQFEKAAISAFSAMS